MLLGWILNHNWISDRSFDFCVWLRNFVYGMWCLWTKINWYFFNTVQGWEWDLKEEGHDSGSIRQVVTRRIGHWLLNLCQISSISSFNCSTLTPHKVTSMWYVVTALLLFFHEFSYCLRLFLGGDSLLISCKCCSRTRCHQFRELFLSRFYVSMISSLKLRTLYLLLRRQ